jgi:hypothetical protein
VLPAKRCAGSALAVLIGSLAACRDGADPRRANIRGEKLLLQKQIDGLHTLIGAAKRGELVGPEQVVVGADESTVERLIGATLPQERVVSKRFHVRLERAQVGFRGNQSVVTLAGRASALGALNTRVALYTLEVRRAAAIGAENRAVRDLAKALGQARIESFAELGPTVVIPIRLHEDIAVGGLDDEPVVATPGRLHVQLTVSKVLAASGRLWVLLDVVAGPWLPNARPDPDR